MSSREFISCNRLAGVGTFMTPQSGMPFYLYQSIDAKGAFHLLP